MTYKLPEPHYKEWSAYTVAEVQEIADAAYAAGLAEGQAIMPMLAGKDEEYWGTVYPNGKPQPSQPAAPEQSHE